MPEPVFTVIGITGIATVTALLALHRQGLMPEDIAARLAVVPLALFLAGAAWHYIVMAGDGSWVAGDYRRSTWFVAINVFIITVVVPAAIVGTLVSLARRLRRRE